MRSAARRTSHSCCRRPPKSQFLACYAITPVCGSALGSLRPGKIRARYRPILGSSRQALARGSGGDRYGATIVARLPVAALLNEMNNIHECWLTSLRYHVPGAVMFMLIGVAIWPWASQVIRPVDVKIGGG